MRNGLERPSPRRDFCSMVSNNPFDQGTTSKSWQRRPFGPEQYGWEYDAPLRLLLLESPPVSPALPAPTLALLLCNNAHPPDSMSEAGLCRAEQQQWDLWTFARDSQQGSWAGAWLPSCHTPANPVCHAIALPHVQAERLHLGLVQGAQLIDRVDSFLGEPARTPAPTSDSSPKTSTLAGESTVTLSHTCGRTQSCSCSSACNNSSHRI